MSLTDKIPLYQRRDIVPPSTFASTQGVTPGVSVNPKASTRTFHPRTVLSNSQNHAANFQQLLFFRECFSKKEFWDECAILERMHYKNKNQHRQATHFARICEVRGKAFYDGLHLVLAIHILTILFFICPCIVPEDSFKNERTGYSRIVRRTGVKVLFREEVFTWVWV